MAGLADGLDRRVRVRGAGNLDQDRVGTLDLHGCLGGAQRVDALLDDGLGGVHLICGGCGAILLGGGENHRDATLDVKAGGDALAERREAEDACHADDSRHHNRGDVAAHGWVHAAAPGACRAS